MATKASFNWEDPLLLDQQLTEEERMVRDSAQQFAQDKLAPRVLEAFRHEQTDPKIFREMGETGLLGATIPEAYGGSGLNYVCYGLIAREVERVDSGYRSMMSVQSSLVMVPIHEFGNEATRQKYLPKLAAGGLELNCQLVLCRGINDGDELRRTLTDLLALRPQVGSIAAVPAGVTDYRDKLYKLTPYDKESAAATLDILEEFSRKCRAEYDRSIVYPSDEWYLTAGRELPSAEFYDEFAQLEDGVGMWRQYHDTFLEELENYRGLVLPHSLDVVTGTLAAPLITDCANALMQRYPQVKIAVHAIRNDYFGGNVSVAGLVTGTDIIKQCKNDLHSDTLAVPEVMLRDEKDRFLDDITLPQLGEALGCRAICIPTDGAGCCRAYLSSHKRKMKLMKKEKREES